MMDGLLVHRRSTIVLTILFCLLIPCWTKAGNYPEWKASCKGNNRRDNGCSIEETDCNVGASWSLTQNLWQTAPLKESVDSLELNPIFNKPVHVDPYNGQQECREDRWYPSLNISWLKEASSSSVAFFVSIKNCTKHYPGGDFEENCTERCFNVTSPHRTTSNITGTKELITLSSKEIREGQLVHVLARVRDLTDIQSRILEASLTLTIDIKAQNIYGLPTHWRQVIPVKQRNMSTLNPLHWTTPLNMWNSSCTREVRVQFQIMPENEYVKKYIIYLGKYEANFTRRADFHPEPNDTVGVVTFSNLTRGIYFVQLLVSEGDCFSRTKNGIGKSEYDYCSPSSHSKCIPVSSGHFHISDAKYCMKPTILPLVAEMDEDSNRVISICLGLSAAIILCLALTWTRIKFKPETTDISFSQQRVLILYCKDNKSHNEVVLKFANLLRTHGSCDVYIDEWDSKGIHEDSLYSWLNKQMNKAEKIIIVVSEGAHNLITARKIERFWPSLESAYLYSKIFPLAVKMLEGASLSGITNRLMSVSFEYTEENSTRKSFRELTGNPHFYNLTSDLGKLLEHIHSCNTQSTTDSRFKRLADKMLMRTEGEQLLSSIQNAKAYHSRNEDWFSMQYGQSVPMPNPNLCNLNGIRNNIYDYERHNHKEQNSKEGLDGVYLNNGHSPCNGNNTSEALLNHSHCISSEDILELV